MPYDLYAASTGGNDGTDGRVVGYFFSNEDAIRAVKGLGVMGHGDGAVAMIGQLYDDFADYQQNNPEAARKRALAKLTIEERRLLGLQE